jgi:hypothetical protein
LPEKPAEEPDVPNGGSSLLSFVVRIWKEDTASEEQPRSWRGHLTPVPNGERHYFTNISQIPELIAAHLNLQK